MTAEMWGMKAANERALYHQTEPPYGQTDFASLPARYGLVKADVLDFMEKDGKSTSTVIYLTKDFADTIWLNIKTVKKTTKINLQQVFQSCGDDLRSILLEAANN